MPKDDGAGRDYASALKDKDRFAALLAQTFEPTEIVRALIEMDLRPSDLALVLDVHPRTIKAWLDRSDQRTAERQRDQILALKSLVLFLLRRGVLSPRELALWLIEPNEKLGFRRPLAALGEGDVDDNLVAVMKAATPFIDPELDTPATVPNPRVAAGAVNRERLRGPGLALAHPGEDEEGVEPEVESAEDDVADPREGL